MKLTNIMMQTIEWQNLLNLKNFSYNKCYNDLIRKYDDRSYLYEIFNVFNDKMGIKSRINNDIDLFNYLKNSNRYFKKVASSYRKKMLKVLNRVVEELDEGYLTDQVVVLKNYSEYIKRDLKEREKEINYKNFI